VYFPNFEPVSRASLSLFVSLRQMRGHGAVSPGFRLPRITLKARSINFWTTASSSASDGVVGQQQQAGNVIGVSGSSGFEFLQHFARSHR